MIIPEVFKESDIIYHYTTSEIAIHHILFKNQLRLSPRKKSIDPIERTNFSIGRMTKQMDEQISKSLMQRNEEHARTLDKLIDRHTENAKQLCFCQNYYSNSKFDKDHFGFLKPRMWDQYGDKYKGVCLAYSKSKLLENNKIKHHGNIEYIDYESLSRNFDTIDLDSLEEVGLEKYSRNIFKRVDKTFLQKHKDYRDENEYRFLSFSEKEFEYIDTQNALIGIFYSPILNESNFLYKQLQEYAINNDADFLYLDWNKNGVSVISENLFKQTGR